MLAEMFNYLCKENRQKVFPLPEFTFTGSFTLI